MHQDVDYMSLSINILGAGCPVDFGFEKSLGIERSQVGQYYNIDPPAIVQSRGFFKAKIDRSGRAEYNLIYCSIRATSAPNPIMVQTFVGICRWKS